MSVEKPEAITPAEGQKPLYFWTFCLPTLLANLGAEGFALCGKEVEEIMCLGHNLVMVLEIASYIL